MRNRGLAGLVSEDTRPRVVFHLKQEKLWNLLIVESAEPV